MGDRFAHQGKAQLSAIISAREIGLDVYPAWNKSNREHTIVGSKPDDLRAEADAAVNALGWQHRYYVDVDHVGLRTVDWFIHASNFFTLDVAEFVGEPADEASCEAFVASTRMYLGALHLPGLPEPIEVTPADAQRAANKFLRALQEAGRIYRHILS